MYSFKVVYSGNEIETLCVAYGLCKVLEDNNIEYVLSNKQSFYCIETDEFDLQELEYLKLDYKNVNNVIPFLTPKYKDGTLLLTDNFIEENLVDIFNYFLTGETNKTFKKLGYIALGNVNYGKGIRGGTIPTQLATKDTGEIYRHMLSRIGWIKGTACVDIQDVSTMFLMLKPIRITSVKKPYGGFYTDKETGEVKSRGTRRNKQDNTALGVATEIYLDSLINYKLMEKSYSKLIIASLVPPATSPMQEKTEVIQIHSFSRELAEELLKVLKWSIYKVDTKNRLAMVVKNIGVYSHLQKFIWDYSCNNYYPIENKNNILEELIDMFSEKVKTIYGDTIVKKIGRELSYLLYKSKGSKGNKTITKLRMANNIYKLQNAIYCLIEEDAKQFGRPFLSEEELETIMNLSETDKESKMVATAIMCYAKVFRESKQEVAEEENVEEIEEINGRKTF